MFASIVGVFKRRYKIRQTKICLPSYGVSP
nr:MAG TPA: Stage II sporulation protein SA domain, toxin-antitoxin, sporulation, TOXIN.5A [Bacteriophage sp.]